MEIDLTVRTLGDKELIAKLREMGSRGVADLQKKANKAAMDLLLREVKNMAPVDSGLLRKSLGLIHRKYGPVSVAVIGPRTGWGRWVHSKWQTLSDKTMAAVQISGRKTFRRIGKAGKSGRGTIYQDPTKYAHLVEGGHIIRLHGKRKSGREVGLVPGRPFMQPAFHASKAMMIALWVAKAKQWIREHTK